MEAVEQLQAGWVGEVGVVCVWGEIVVRVGGVDGVGFGGEVPERAVVGGADVGDPFYQRLGRFGIWRRARDEAEA